MNRNHLKIIACISMAIDHVGYVIFPEFEILRILGRIAMPIFAFFIGEGCYYTRDRKKYFLRLFILGLICQCVYIAESLVTKSGNGLYLNILFTFSFSVILCGSFLNFKNDRTAKNRNIFILCLAGFYLLDLFFDRSRELVGVNIALDYGFEGICLPLFAVMAKDKKSKIFVYSLGLLIFSFLSYGLFNWYFVFAMIPSLLLLFYNGEGGRMNLKYFFYLFYPLHLVLIYGVNLILNM